MSYNNSNNRSPYIANPLCNQTVKNALSNGYVNQDELNKINGVCKTEEGLNIFDKIYSAVKDGKFESGELTDILQTPGGSTAVASLLKTILTIFDRLQTRINDGNLTIQEYNQFKHQIEKQGTVRGSSTSNVDIDDIIGRLLLSAINTSVQGFPKPVQYNGNQNGGKKQSKGSKRMSKKSSKNLSKKSSKKGSKKGGAKKTSKKGSKKMIKKGSKKSKASKA